MTPHHTMPWLVPLSFACLSTGAVAQELASFEARRVEIRSRYLAADRAGDLAAKREAVRELEELELQVRESTGTASASPAPAFESAPSSPGLGRRGDARPVTGTSAPRSTREGLLAAAGSQGPTLRRGSMGPEVAALQSRLGELGYDAGRADGVFGASTEKAVRAFQKDAGLEPDGVVGPGMRRALATAVEEGPLAEAVAGETLERGSSGEAVRELERRLTALGYPVEADGAYDESTAAAVRAFQKDHGIEPNGRFGRTTLGALRKAERSDRDVLERVVRSGTVLGRDAEGPAVRSLQERLSALGHGVRATGRLGPTTEDAIRAFQKDRGLEETGRVGPTTLDALVAAEKSAGNERQRKALLDAARAHARGRRPGGRCYAWVSTYIDQAGYGGIPKGGFGTSIPSGYWAEAKDFARYLNQGDNAARLGLRRLDIDNPYDAPAGAIVVVAPGSPGTRHPTAGDITVADGEGRFYNDGDMSYGGRDVWPPARGGVLGVYVPAR